MAGRARFLCEIRQAIAREAGRDFPVLLQFASNDDSVPDTKTITTWVNRALAAAGNVDGELSVRVVDTVEMQALNRDYRSKDRPTNVLSFPAASIEGLPADADVPLGDIVICREVVRDEAERQDKAIADHWAHMIVHGTLHLLGFDHMNDREAAEMEGLEIKILADYGIPDPYGESPQET